MPAVTRQGLRRVVPRRVDLALGTRGTPGRLARPVAGVGVREADTPVAEPATESPHEPTVDSRRSGTHLLPLAPNDGRAHAAGRHFHRRAAHAVLGGLDGRGPGGPRLRRRRARRSQHAGNSGSGDKPRHVLPGHGTGPFRRSASAVVELHRRDHGLGRSSGSPGRAAKNHRAAQRRAEPTPEPRAARGQDRPQGRKRRPGRLRSPIPSASERSPCVAGNPCRATTDPVLSPLQPADGSATTAARPPDGNRGDLTNLDPLRCHRSLDPQGTAREHVPPDTPVTARTAA